MIVEYFLEWVESAPVSKRIAATDALVRAWLHSPLNEEERDETEAAITTLLEDPAPGVRLALAEGFGAWKTAPRHVMTTLARDNIDISAVVLSRSPVFFDTELIDMVATGRVEQQIAIACRPWVSPALVAAICEVSHPDACLGLLMNPVVQFSNRDLHRLAERHGTITDIRTTLLERPDLSPEIRILLINKLGEALNQFVSKRSWMSSDRADRVIKESCDKASIAFAANAADGDVDRVVKSLIAAGSMTAAFLLRAICMGNITLAAKAFSELSGVRFERVETILTHDRRSAFKAVYDRAGLPNSAFGVFYCAISTWRRLLSSGSPINQSRLPFLVTREVLQSYTGEQDAVMDELLILLRKLAAETARESARSKAAEIVNRSRAVTPAPEEVEDAEIVELSEADLACFSKNLEEELNSLGEEFELDIEVKIPADQVEAQCRIETNVTTVDFEVVPHDVHDAEPDVLSLSQSILNQPVAEAA